MTISIDVLEGDVGLTSLIIPTPLTDDLEPIKTKEALKVAQSDFSKYLSEKKIIDSPPNLEDMKKFMENIVSGKIFHELRFEEDDDAEYFLRVQRSVQQKAKSILDSQ